MAVGRPLAAPARDHRVREDLNASAPRELNMCKNLQNDTYMFQYKRDRNKHL